MFLLLATCRHFKWEMRPKTGFRGFLVSDQTTWSTPNIDCSCWRSVQQVSHQFPHFYMTRKLRMDIFKKSYSRPILGQFSEALKYRLTPEVPSCATQQQVPGEYTYMYTICIIIYFRYIIILYNIHIICVIYTYECISVFVCVCVSTCKCIYPHIWSLLCITKPPLNNDQTTPDYLFWENHIGHFDF
jgi:hypothetical protein